MEDDMTLTEFLLARIAEDEEVARGAGRDDAWEQGERYHERNVVRPVGGFDWVGVSGDRLDIPVLTAQSSSTPRELFEGRARHIARHDPARVLAECEAKRLIVEHFSETGIDFLGEIARVPLRALAAVYADHPDYDEAWRP